MEESVNQKEYINETIDIYEVDKFTIYNMDIEPGMICNDIINTYVVDEVVLIKEDECEKLLSIKLLQLDYSDDYINILNDEDLYILVKYVKYKGKYRFDDFIIPNDSRISLINFSIGKPSIYRNIVNLQHML